MARLDEVGNLLQKTRVIEETLVLVMCKQLERIKENLMEIKKTSLLVMKYWSDLFQDNVELLYSDIKTVKKRR